MPQVSLLFTLQSTQVNIFGKLEQGSTPGPSALFGNYLGGVPSTLAFTRGRPAPVCTHDQRSLHGLECSIPLLCVGASMLPVIPAAAHTAVTHSRHRAPPLRVIPR